ncbi:hypothetical protein BpHYR1_011153, partial [Brachionus plicatilis]
MNLLNETNKNLKDFIISNGLVNYVTETTRTMTKFYQNACESKTTSTLIDVVLHNGTLVKDCKVFKCSFSDHDLISIKLTFPPKKKNRLFITGRKLNEASLSTITYEINKLNLKNMYSEIIEQMWQRFKTSISQITDKYAPETKIY